MINSFDIANQGLVMISAMITLYYSFIALNACTSDTKFLIRVSLIIILPGSAGLILFILGNHVPHWSFTLIMIGLAVKLAGERRRVALRPIINSDLKSR